MELLYTTINYLTFSSGKTPNVKFSARLSGADAGFLKCVCFNVHILMLLKDYSPDDRFNIAGRLTNKRYVNAQGVETISAQLVVYGLEKCATSNVARVPSRVAPIVGQNDQAMLDEALGLLPQQQVVVQQPLPQQVMPQPIQQPLPQQQELPMEVNLDWIDDLNK